jgi:mannose-6-phosphate isomerase-like protein (cupin superfamily)
LQLQKDGRFSSGGNAGTGLVEIGDEKKAIGKDLLVESPARIPHKWTNESKAVLWVLVVKVPKPTEETKLL